MFATGGRAIPFVSTKLQIYGWRASLTRGEPESSLNED